MTSINFLTKELNTIGKYLAKRDICHLTKSELKNNFGIESADLLILFGGTIPYGCDVAAEAYKNGIAKKIMVVGGEGHTTEALRKEFRLRYPEIKTEGRMEADIISDYLNLKYSIKDCIIERNSTNCGNNVSYALDVVHENNLDIKHVIIIQDSTMQRRMDATFKKIWALEDAQIINFAPYIAEVIVKNEHLSFREKNLWGMWSIDHYITLLMGEIPRLCDNKDGYGPKGKNFIAHVDIPNEVLEAFQYLKEYYSSHIRVANEKYKS